LLSADETEVLMRLLEAEGCSPVVKERVQKLADEVKRLGAILEMMSRIMGKSMDSDNDTLIA